MRNQNLPKALRLKVIAFICLFAICTDTSYPYAQPDELLFDKNYTITRVFNTGNILPANGVSGLIQDSRGYIWAATYNGLIRFDGKKVLIYNNSNIENLSSNRFVQVTEDEKGRVWAALEFNQILRIDGHNTKVFALGEDMAADNVNITALSSSPDGIIWIGTRAGAYVLENDTISHLENLPEQVVRSFIQYDKKTYLLMSSGVYSFNGKEFDRRVLGMNEYVHIITENYTVTGSDSRQHRMDAFTISDGDIYLTSHHGLHRFREHSYEIIKPRSVLYEGVIKGLHSDQEAWYVYGENGIVVHAKHGGSHTPQHFERGMNVSDVIFDHEHSMWMATLADGIKQVVPTPVYQGDTFSVIKNQALFAVYGNADGDLYVGTNCDGLYHFNNEEFQKYSYENGFTNNCISSLMETADKRLWAGSWGGGVYQMNPGTRGFERFQQQNEQFYGDIIAMLEAGPDTIFFGTYYGGLFKSVHDIVTNIRNRNGDVLSAVRYLYKDDSGKVWAATDNGLGYLEDDRIIKSNAFRKLTSNRFRVIAQDADGHIWAGTEGGGLLIIKDDSLLIPLSSEHGLPDQTV